MKHFSKVMALALVLGAITACAVGCVGPESDDSGVNQNTDTTATTTQRPTTQVPTTEAATTTEGALGSIAGDVSDALTDGMTTETTTTAPARTRGMRGREGK